MVKVIYAYFASVAGNDSHQTICSQVARLLREEREKQNLSLNALAERAGLSRQMVSYVEQDKRNPTLDTLLRITGALDLQLEDLIKRSRLADSKRRRK